MRIPIMRLIKRLQYPNDLSEPSRPYPFQYNIRLLDTWTPRRKEFYYESLLHSHAAALSAIVCFYEDERESDDILLPFHL